MSASRHRSGLLVVALALVSLPHAGHAQVLPGDNMQDTGDRYGAWRVDLEAGFRLQGEETYRGLYLAPGLWYEIQPGLQLGLFAPLHFRTSPAGRVGMQFSLGLEPRLRFEISKNLSAELAVGLATENQAEVQGVSSYSAGVQLGKLMSLRYTHERYRLSPDFYASGVGGDASANFIDLAFTGGVGRRLAHGEVLVFLLIAAVTAGAR